MYDDKAGPAPDLPDFGPIESAPKRSIFSRVETVIPIILIVLFLLFFAISFLKVDPSSIPLIGGAVSYFYSPGQTQILIIGQPQQETLDLLNRGDFAPKYRYTVMSTDRFVRTQLNLLKSYDIVILDQSELADKSIPDALTNDLRNYVEYSGGSLIIVADSALWKSGRPQDSFGWVAVLGSDMAPVDCQVGFGNIRPCQNPEIISGRAVNIKTNLKTFEGIDVVPGDGRSFPFTVYDVTPSTTNGRSDEWFIIQDSRPGGKSYTGIVSKRAGIGKVVYFNYNNIWITPNLLDKVFQYMK